MMKTWYCVTSSYDDRGKTTAAITATMEAEEKPDSSFRSTSWKDISHDLVLDIQAMRWDPFTIELFQTKMERFD